MQISKGIWVGREYIEEMKGYVKRHQLMNSSNKIDITKC